MNPAFQPDDESGDGQERDEDSEEANDRCVRNPANTRDRNPQRFIANIAYARPEDFTRATHRIHHAPGGNSFVDLPVFEESQGRR
jgi:hypothetical protein